ncbi:MAG: phenylalanine--tRNA ligase subunit alpha [bacterium]
MLEELQKIKEKILLDLSLCKDLLNLGDLEVKYMGRKGEFTEQLKKIAELSLEEKKTTGKLANEIKRELDKKFSDLRDSLYNEGTYNMSIDPTLPGKQIIGGHLHPLSQVQYELEDLFVSMGFMVLDGPELESDFYNFEALNIPPHHPARDMQDTFYIDKKNKEGELDLVMRTQTSSVQVRAMRKYGAPLRCVIPGRTFRCEATDARHEHTFYQVEGIMLDENVNMVNMKSVLETLVKSLYGQETQLRLRPKFYPFVEPGSNIEVTCFLCQGAGCRVCKHSGWLEVGGCGMVHPNVLRAGNVNPDKHQGFAFGFGLTRLTMLKYGITDIRYLQSDDMRFLGQF